MTEIPDDEAAKLRQLLGAISLMGDGDFTKGIALMRAIMTIGRSLGHEDPAEGVEDIKEALRLADQARSAGRIAKWVIGAALA
ncbi:MAG: hypothetical protein ACRCS0_09140, partial [Albidovulum sp.]